MKTISNLSDLVTAATLSPSVREDLLSADEETLVETASNVAEFYILPNLVPSRNRYYLSTSGLALRAEDLAAVILIGMLPSYSYDLLAKVSQAVADLDSKLVW